MKSLIAALIIIAVCCGQAWGATTYTVCSSGCDHTTVQAAFDNHDMGDDDVVEVRAATVGGTAIFRELVTWGSNDIGTAGHPVTLRGRTGDHVIITGANLVTTWSGSGPTWTATVTTQPYIVTVDGVVGTLEASAGAVDAEGEWFWDSNTLTIYSATAPSGRTIEVGNRSKCIVLGAAVEHAKIANLTLQGWNQYYAIDNRASYTEIDNMTIEKGRSTGIILYGPVNHARITRSKITGIGSKGSTASYGINLAAYSAAGVSDNVTIEDTEVSGFVMPGMFLSGWDEANRSTNVNVARCNVHDNGDGVYYRMVNDGNVTDTIMDSNTNTAGAGEGSGFAFSAASNIKVSGCRMTNNRLSGVQVWGSTSSSYGPTDGGGLFRNVISGNAQYGIFYNGPNVDNFVVDANLIYGNTLAGINYSSASGTSTGNVIYNNSVASSGNYPFRLTSTGSGLTLRNNLFYSSSASYAAFYDGGGSGNLQAHSNNLYYSPATNVVYYAGTNYTVATGTTFESTGVFSDPLLVNASGGDFHLRSGSPAIDSGNATICAQYPTDYAGLNQLRYGRGCEIGAYVFPHAAMPGGM